MERLSGLDASFLYLESPTNHMHVAATMTFDPSTVEGGYSFEKTRDLVQRRLHLIPQFTRRLATVPFNLHHPVWVEDPDFDLDYHLRRIAAPAPGSYHELADMAGDIASRPLDRSRPLWEIYVVEGLEHGHIGTIAKMHHSTIDGVSGANLMVYLFDLEPNPAEEPEGPEREPEHMPSDAELLAYAMRSRLRRPLQLASVIPKAATSVVNVVRERRSTDTVNPPAPLTAPRTSFNGAITAHRKVAYAIASLSDVKAIKNAFGTTVNDVVLAVVGGGLRRYLERTQQLPDKSLIATVPISVRPPEGEEDTSIGANKVSAMFTSLATHVEDPVERLRTIHEVTKGAKEEHNAVGADMLQSLTEFAAPRLFGLAMRFYSSSKLADRGPVIHNLVISNVPGPPFPLYFAGAKLISLFPMGPVMEGAGLNITVISYMDDIDIGLMVARESVPDVWDMAADIEESLAELKKAADAKAGTEPADAG
ncbi:MAG TPA: wax ester/triacylglycerol synthase family O-acyltransferase [Acidimicrobiales bacterium]|nr:wax ester/triacylglycerol synthase family O-acyltransferase [Acidimicrobiales bacterium]